MVQVISFQSIITIECRDPCFLIFTIWSNKKNDIKDKSTTNQVFWIRENIISGIKLKNYNMGFTLIIERNFKILIMKIILHCGILTPWAFHWHDEIRRQYGLVQAETFIQDFVERLPTLLSFYQGFMKCSFWDSVWNYKDKNMYQKFGLWFDFWDCKQSWEL